MCSALCYPLVPFFSDDCESINISTYHHPQIGSLSLCNANPSTSVPVGWCEALMTFIVSLNKLLNKRSRSRVFWTPWCTHVAIVISHDSAVLDHSVSITSYSVVLRDFKGLFENNVTYTENRGLSCCQQCLHWLTGVGSGAASNDRVGILTTVHFQSMCGTVLHLLICVPGWGWMCVFGQSINSVVTTLLIRAFGVTYLQLLKHYDSSPAAVAWVGALSMTCTGMFGKTIRVTSHEPHAVWNHR